jgi:pimeloyl-ACP methyl ester carboxylesterase
VSGYAAVSRTGGVFAAELDTVWYALPKAEAGTVPVVLCHGASVVDTFTRSVAPNAVNLAARIARAGIPCIAGAFGGDTWGNSTGVSRINAALTYLNAQTGSSTTRCHVLGISHGSMLATMYAAAHPEKVASVTGFIPCSNLDAHYQSDSPAGSRASIGTAWGVTYPTALPAGANALTAAAVIAAAEIPYRLYYSTVDAFVATADVLALAAAAGGEAIAIDTVNGHLDATVGLLPVETLIANLQNDA